MGRLKILLTMSRDFAAAICITLVEVARDLYCSLHTVVDYTQWPAASSCETELVPKLH